MNQKPLPELPFEPERYELYEEPRYQFEQDRRDFLRAVGGGIVVFLVLGEADAQQPGRGGGRGRGGFGGGGTQDLAARLHIAEDGTVTVYTSKVEVSQNSRTSLTQAVAATPIPAPASAAYSQPVSMSPPRKTTVSMKFFDL